jgi:hypothetical protein
MLRPDPYLMTLISHARGPRDLSIVVVSAFPATLAPIMILLDIRSWEERPGR